MGCDIHAFVEYQTGSDHRPWESYSKDELYLPRNYVAFGAMTAGKVRNPFAAEGRDLVEPRGIPSDVSWYTDEQWNLWIANSDEEYLEEERSVSIKQALDYTKYGSLITEMNPDRKWVKVDGLTEDTLREKLDQGSLMKVEGPDWHTPSWLSTDEYVEAINGAYAYSRFEGGGYEALESAYDAPYWATIDLMKGLEAHTGNSARIVFWFDN